MAISYIPALWQKDIRINPFRNTNLYFNIRGKIYPPINEERGITFIKNDRINNARGTFRLKTTNYPELMYLYTLPQRFIVEGWFKPCWNYIPDTSQNIFDDNGSNIKFYYHMGGRKFVYLTTPSNVIHETLEFKSNSELQRWVNVRLYFDNIGKVSGFFCAVNGIVIADNYTIVPTGDFRPLNRVSFFKNASIESSYWIIHEIDKTLSSNDYKNYNAERQIIFDFNGTVLGRERILIPKSLFCDFSITKTVEDSQTGSAGANTARLGLFNNNGEFSDDQYDAFAPENGHYNGIQKYLRNRIYVEIETVSPSHNTVKKGLILHWSFDRTTTQVEDDTGFGNNGIKVNIQNTFGKVGQAIKLISSTSNVTSVIPMPSNNKNRTIALWFKSSVLPTAYGGTGVYIGMGIGRIRFLKLDSSGQWVPNVALGSQYDFNTIITGNICDDKWHYLVAVYNRAGNVNYYKDGLLVGQTNSIAGASSINWEASSLKIDWATMPYILDEIKIWERLLTSEEIKSMYDNPCDSGSLHQCEPLFIGQTTPGAFSRSTTSLNNSSVTIDVEDFVSVLGETKLNKSYVFNNTISPYIGCKISDPINPSLSLIHLLINIVAKVEIKNYIGNSNFIMANLLDSWTNMGLTLRTSSVAEVYTNSLECTATAAGDKLMQCIAFKTTEFIDIKDTFNFSIFIYQTIPESVKIIIDELSDTGVLGISSEAFCDTEINRFKRISVWHTVQSIECTQLRITIYALKATVFLLTGAMLIRGIDYVDTYIPNNANGINGIVNANNAQSKYFNFMAVDAEVINLSHPCVTIFNDSTVWEHIKDLGVATLASYIGMTADNIFKYKTRLGAYEILGLINDITTINTNLDINSLNSIVVKGITIDKTEINRPVICNAENISGFIKNNGGKLLHPIRNGEYLEVLGSKEIELNYNTGV